MSAPTVFALECGCLLSLDGGTNEPCLVHEHEQITPIEAMVIVFRTRLAEDTEEEALSFIFEKRKELNEGRPVDADFFGWESG